MIRGIMRIVSLLPSSTEFVFAFDMGEHLVGRSHECDFPPHAEKLPVCSRPKINYKLSSAAIDHQVRAMVQEGLSVFLVDENRLKELEPTLILTQVHCKVCAVSLEDVQQAICEWTESDVPLVSLEPNTLNDIWEDALKVADALGVLQKGRNKVQEWQQRMAMISEKAQSIDNPPTVATIEWIDPIMAGGNWFPDLISMAGGVNMFGHANQSSPVIEWEMLLQANPDFIVIVPCGFQIPRTRNELQPLLSRPEWQKLNAVQNQRVFLADGHHYFNRPGPRIVESLEILAEILHPEHFHFGHQETGWEPL